MNHWNVTIESLRGDLTFTFTDREEAFLVWNVFSNQWRTGSMRVGNGHAQLDPKQITRVRLVAVDAARPFVRAA